MWGLRELLALLERSDVAEVIVCTDRCVTAVVAGQITTMTHAPVTALQMTTLLTSPELLGLTPMRDGPGDPVLLSIDGRPYEITIGRTGPSFALRMARAALQPTVELDPPDPAVDAAVIDAEAILDPTPEAAPAPPPAPAPAAAPEAAPVVVEPEVAPQRDAQLSALLAGARRVNATDVHVVAGRPALVRRVGALEPSGAPLPPADVERMLQSLLTRRQREALASVGYVDLAIEDDAAGRMRVNVNRQRTGLKGCFRMVGREPPTLESLGLPAELAKVASYHQGLAVVSGPNGHGKTTTMAAIIDLINASKPAHIITVEDPIEFIFPRRKSVITQRQVGPHTDSFHAALKAALREDPDVIAIGELRDLETVEMALSAAETGHLVVATMSAPSGAKTIDRIIDMFPAEDQPQVRATLAGALKIVVSQRLLPSGDGQRMVAAAELITGNVPLWALIRDNKLFQLPSLLQRGRAFGMIRLEDSLRDLLARGVITEEVAMSVADDPRALKASPEPAAAPEPPRKPGAALRSLFGKGE